MILKHLKIHNLRCYESAEINADPKFNIFVGNNGQGKTSFIEAVGLLSFFKSFRGAKNNELLRVGQEIGNVQGTAVSDDLEFNLEVKVWPTRKQALFNGKHCRFLSEYVGKLRAVSFSPEDLEIIRGAPANRRNWIDRVSQIFSDEHVDYVSQYQKILDQRNRLLKDAQKNRSRLDISLLETWDDELARTGAHILQNRIESIRQIVPKIHEFYGTISHEKTSIFARYFRSDLKEESGQNTPAHDTFLGLDEAQKSLAEALKSRLEKDLILGSTSVGPHRDDLEFTLDSNLVQSFASQGEVRSLVMAMRLAEVECTKEKRNISPLLLIDDFSSELDQRRGEFLLKYLHECDSQVFLTTTEPIRIGKVFVVENGTVSV